MSAPPPLDLRAQLRRLYEELDALRDERTEMYKALERQAMVVKELRADLKDAYAVTDQSIRKVIAYDPIVRAAFEYASRRKHHGENAAKLLRAPLHEMYEAVRALIKANGGEA